MKHLTLILLVAVLFTSGAATFAQRPHPMPGGPPSGQGGRPSDTGPGNGSGMGSAHEGEATTRTDMSHASPSEVLNHNTAIAGKIQGLTGQDAQTACNGFKNMGQCLAAAHVAKNLNIPGGFDTLKTKITGSSAVSLGKAIQGLAPDADAKAEAKKANKQASDDMKEASSPSS